MADEPDIDVEDSGYDELLQQTASFVDAVINGETSVALHILDNETIDLDADMMDIEQYMCTEPPYLRIDVLNTSDDVTPGNAIGCVLAGNCPTVMERVMTSHAKPDTITDHDAIICIYNSDLTTFRLALEHYPEVMTNRRLRTGFNTRVPYLTCFSPLFAYCYTPIHVAILSCFIYRRSSINYRRCISFFTRQFAKIITLTGAGAYLDGRRSYGLNLGGQLILHEEFVLFEKCFQTGLIYVRGEDMVSFFNQFLHHYKTESLKYILKDTFLQHLDFPENDEFLGHDVVLRRSYLRSIDTCQRDEITELLVHNNFIFTGSYTYDIRMYDTPARLYNLFHAGVYITDTRGNHKFLNPTSPVVKREIKSILKRSKSPFSLERLCGLKVKSILGPKNHYYKLKCLKDYLPIHVLYSLALVRFTKQGRIPAHWCIPRERVGDKPYSDVFKTPSDI